MTEFEVRSCIKQHPHDPHLWGDRSCGGPPYRCDGDGYQLFYRDWERKVRRFYPPGPDQRNAARRMLDALGNWAEISDTAGSRWAVKFRTWLANYETPPTVAAFRDQR